MMIWQDKAPRTFRHLPPALSQVPAFPPTASLLMQLLSSTQCQISEIVKLVQTDAVFVAEILSVANSAAYSTSQRVKAVNQAIALIGFDRLRSLTLRVALRSIIRTALTSGTARRCWAHCLASAATAWEFAAPLGVNRDEAYTLGLLHDVGRIGLLAAHTDTYCGLLGSGFASAAEVLRAERDRLGLDHCEAGKMLADHWALPSIIQNVTGCHHETLSRPASRELLLSQVACRIADKMQFGVVLSSESLDDILKYCPDGFRDAVQQQLASLGSRLMKELSPLYFC